MFQARCVVYGYALALCLWAGVETAATPLGTAFTYQGQLKQGDVPVTTTAAMTFQMFDASTAGTSVGPLLSFPAVSVVNGLFTVTLDFGPSVFDGNARWLQIAVNGQTLSPRQPVTAAPYSLETRGIFVADNGFVGFGRSTAISSAEYLGLRAPVSGTNYGGMYVETGSATAKPFYGYATNGTGRAWHYLDGTSGSWRLNNGGDRLTITSTGDVGIGTITPDNRLHVFKGSAGTVTGDANAVVVVENSTNAYLSFLTPDASERGVLFGEASNNVAGGIIYNTPATPEGFQFRTNGNVSRMSLDNAGNLGIGTADAATPLEVAMSDKRFQIRFDGGVVPGINLTGTGGNLGILRIRNKIEMWPNDAQTSASFLDLRNTSNVPTLQFDGSNGNASFTGNLSFGSATRQMLNLWGSVYGIGVQGFTEYFRSDGGFAWFNKGSHNDSTNNPGAGGSVLMVLDSSGNLGIGAPSPAAKLDVNGRTRTKSLEIVGGADLAEPVEIEGGAEPGMVVVIDPDHAGRFKVATEPYDRKAAGILSGANGLPAGMVMHAEGDVHANGGPPLALSGRVWCWCDATYGAITPGDLLTTSATTGHAMRVADDKAAPRGCIIGKAMTPLSEGKGLVLVLVNLQ